MILAIRLLLWAYASILAGAALSSLWVNPDNEATWDMGCLIFASMLFCGGAAFILKGPPS